jgi:hypothetical protein
MKPLNQNPKVLVFKSNIRLARDIKKVGTLIEKRPDVLKWNVDRHDIDHVLRIEAAGIDAAEVEQLITKAGYFCKELPD